jgi:hypothetical protein
MAWSPRNERGWACFTETPLLLEVQLWVAHSRGSLLDLLCFFFNNSHCAVGHQNNVCACAEAEFQRTALTPDSRNGKSELVYSHAWIDLTHPSPTTVLTTELRRQNIDRMSTLVSTTETRIRRLTTNMPDRDSNIDTLLVAKTGQWPFRLD